MRPILAVLGATCALTLFGPMAHGVTSHDDAREEILFWRGAMNCGPNCLYLLLKSAGHDVAYQDLVESMDVGPRGTSLLDLRDAALASGHRVSLYKGTTDDLSSIELPVILHLDKESGRIDGMGHFVLLASYNEDLQQATLFDGTTGSSSAISFEAMRRMWSGYLLALDEGRELWHFAIAMGATMALCIGLAAVVRRLQHRVIP